MRPKSFHVRIENDVLRELNHRLDATRALPAISGVGWERGTPPDVLAEWLERWRGFDWRAAEERLNRYPQFTGEAGGTILHFVHARAEATDAAPLLLMNGWPSTFAELLPLVDRLTRPGDGKRTFHVVIPSLPGYGFSPAPAEPGWGPTKMAAAMAELMSALGYERFGVHGSDMGAAVMLALEQTVPDRLIGAHSVNVYWAYPRPDDITEEEKAWLQKGQEWAQAEGAYAMIQSTKAHTLAASLSDSPAGLAAWVLEKWQGWTDGGLGAYDPDEVLAMLTIFWATNSLASSIQMYAETRADPIMTQLKKTAVPTGVLIMPKDLLPAPRVWGDRWIEVVRWTEAEHGGHFPAIETPDLLAGEIRATFAAITAR